MSYWFSYFDQAKVIDLTKLAEETRVEQIAKLTGWQHHTIQGVISDSLKKKLGLRGEATKEDGHAV